MHTILSSYISKNTYKATDEYESYMIYHTSDLDLYINSILIKHVEYDWDSSDDEGNSEDEED